MTYYMRAIAEPVDPQAQAGTPIRFIASTEGVKRDGKELRSEAWRIDNFRRNPVVLWAHDYIGNHLPVGRAEVGFQDRAMTADVTFDTGDEFGANIDRKYRSGFLHAVSVGWDELADGNELLDISAVPVPGDPDALIQRQLRALRAVTDALSVTQSESHDQADGERTGAVLNSRNMERLQQAAGLLQEVLDSAKKQAADKTEDKGKEEDRQAAEILTRLKEVKL